MLTSIFVHTALHHGRAIYNAILGRRIEEEDIHLKLMWAYPEVSGWIYAVVGTIAFSLSIVATQVWGMGTPFWVTMLAVMVPVTHILPSALVWANTGVAVCCGSLRAIGYLLTSPTQIPLNLISQIIPGLLAPGDVMTNMVCLHDGSSIMHALNGTQLFKSFAIQSMYTGTQITQDLKLAHYMKIPPRTTFCGTPRDPASTSVVFLT